MFLCAGRVTLANPDTSGNLIARPVAERSADAPGEQVALALVLDIRPGWHTYWHNRVEIDEPPSIQSDLPTGAHPPVTSTGPIPPMAVR